MNRQTWIALLLAAAAALLTYYYVSEKEAAIRADVTPLKVLVAKNPIARGTRMTSDRVLVDEIPGAYVAPGTLAASSRDQVIQQWQECKDQYALTAIAKGEPILRNKLSKLMPGFAGAVPEGMRVISLGLELASAVGGNLKPGNRVDVIGTFAHKYQNVERKTSVALVQNTLVTAVGGASILDAAKTEKTNAAAEANMLNVCLAVAPEDAVRLSLAEREGSLKLALRAPGDEAPTELADQNLGTLLGPLLKVRKDEIQTVKKEIQIIRGVQ